MHSLCFLTLTLLTIGARSQDQSTINPHDRATATEGEDVELNFPYPCESARVTVQHRDKAPFYNSMFPNSLTLKPDQLGRLTVSNVTENGNCSISINIAPVMSADEGPYILLAYNANHTTRIMLVVDFPTDKLYCSHDGWFLEGYVVRLLCTAPAVHGPLTRQIQCFQGGMRMAPVSEPTQTDMMIEQTMMALHNEHLVFCCSSALLVPRAQCQCNDFIWDPVLYRESSHKEDPCPDPGNAITSLAQDSRCTVSQSNKIHAAASIPPGMRNKKDTNRPMASSIVANMTTADLVLTASAVGVCIGFFCACTCLKEARELPAQENMRDDLTNVLRDKDSILGDDLTNLHRDDEPEPLVLPRSAGNS